MSLRRLGTHPIFPRNKQPLCVCFREKNDNEVFFTRQMIEVLSIPSLIKLHTHSMLHLTEGSGDDLEVEVPPLLAFSFFRKRD